MEFTDFHSLPLEVPVEGSGNPSKTIKSPLNSSGSLRTFATSKIGLLSQTSSHDNELTRRGLTKVRLHFLDDVVVSTNHGEDVILEDLPDHLVERDNTPPFERLTFFFSHGIQDNKQ